MTDAADGLAATDEESKDGAQRVVTAHRCTPDRTVFTESENSDGWIATDVTVDVTR